MCKDITANKDANHEESTEEAYLALPDLIGEEIDQCKEDGKSQTDEGYHSPAINTGHIDQGTVPGNEEHLLLRHNLVDGFRTRHLQVKADIRIAWRQQQCPFVIENGTGDIFCAIISITQVIVQL